MWGWKNFSRVGMMILLLIMVVMVIEYMIIMVVVVDFLFRKVRMVSYFLLVLMGNCRMRIFGLLFMLSGVSSLVVVMGSIKVLVIIR